MNENKTRTYRLRMVIALAILAVVAVGYFAAGGIGNICGIGFESLTLLCPLGRSWRFWPRRPRFPWP